MRNSWELTDMMSRSRRSAIQVLLVLILTLGFAQVGGAGQPPAAELPTLAPLIKKVAPGVVNIATRSGAGVEENPLFEDPAFRRFFGLPEDFGEWQNQSVGSGVIIDAARGHIVTNHHVIARAEEILATLKDGRQLKAELLGFDDKTDVALLRVKPDKLRALAFGDSDDLEVGDYVVAIGNPFGLGQSITAGVVSALGRSGLGIEDYEDFIQTDASINPGNSGGALIDLRGRLIGINTAIIGQSGNIGIGFAIPINMVRAVVGQILVHGEVKRGRLGVYIQDVTPDLRESLSLPSTAGALISKVEPGSPAERAGLQAGDVIVGIDGRDVRNAANLRNEIGLMRPGRRIELQVIRKGVEQRVEVELTALNSG